MVWSFLKECGIRSKIRPEDRCMAKLFEYQGKELLREKGISIPEGYIAKSVRNVEEIAARFQNGSVVKAQVLRTGRGKSGGIAICENSQEAREVAEKLFGMVMKENHVEVILVEERIEATDEFFFGITLDDQWKGPILILSPDGGINIEELAENTPSNIGRIAIDYLTGIKREELQHVIDSLHFPQKSKLALEKTVMRLYGMFKTYEMTSLEINPLFYSPERGLIAGDCKIAVDDYAVFRHPELNEMIEIPREFSHAPTELEKRAWMVEKDDYRGTFYFSQLVVDIKEKGYVAYHGGGGGGSMACMDKLLKYGLKPACYVDTSGNPSESKIYKAIKIILAIPGIEGYLWISDAVASQDLSIGARALIQALREEKPTFPTVVRLVGYKGDEAKSLVQEAVKKCGLRVEYYTDEVTTEYCIKRMKALIEKG